MGVSASPSWGNLTGKPTTLAGYGVAAGDALFANITAGNASVAPWAGVSGKPTTVAGFGITDAVKADNGSGAIGSFCVCSCSSAVADGATVAGSSLLGRSITTSGTWAVPSVGSTLSGTWRNVGDVAALTTNGNCVLFQRIA